MKKKIILVMAAVLTMSMIFAACGGGVSSDGASTAGEANADSAPTAEAAADAVTLRLTHHDPPTSATGKFLDAWAAMVLEKSEGKLAVEVMHGGSLAGPRESLDMLKTGSVDIAWGLQGFYGGIFPMTEVMMLPMMDIQSAEQGSAVMWDLYNTTDYLKEEYSEFQVILLHTNCDSPVSTKSKKIEQVSDINGMNIRTNAGPPTTFLQALGGVVQEVPVGELYPSLEKGVLDGVITDWHAIGSFKLFEQLQYYLDAHVQVSPYWLMMNKDVYAGLPEDLQKVIDDCSGENALAIAGSFWDDAQTAAQEEIANAGGEIYTLSDEESAKMTEIGDEVKAGWIAEKGGDAQALFDETVALIEKHAGK